MNETTADVLPDGFNGYLSRCAQLERSESACLRMCERLFESGPFHLSEWLLMVEYQLEWKINKRPKANADFIDFAKDPKTKPETTIEVFRQLCQIATEHEWNDFELFGLLKFYTKTFINKEVRR